MEDWQGLKETDNLFIYKILKILYFVDTTF